MSFASDILGGADDGGDDSAQPGLFGSVRDVFLGAQETIRSVVEDVTDVPGDVSGDAAEAGKAAAEAAAEAAAAPFNAGMFAVGAVLVGFAADQALNQGKALKTITG